MGTACAFKAVQEDYASSRCFLSSRVFPRRLSGSGIDSPEGSSFTVVILPHINAYYCHCESGTIILCKRSFRVRPPNFLLEPLSDGNRDLLSAAVRVDIVLLFHGKWKSSSEHICVAQKMESAQRLRDILQIWQNLPSRGRRQKSSTCTRVEPRTV